MEKREGEEDDEAQVGAVFGLLAFYCHQNSGVHGMSSGGWGKKYAAKLGEQTVLKWGVALLPLLSLLCLNVFLPSYSVVNNDFRREIVLIISSCWLALTVSEYI